MLSEKYSGTQFKLSFCLLCMWLAPYVATAAMPAFAVQILAERGWFDPLVIVFSFILTVAPFAAMARLKPSAWLNLALVACSGIGMAVFMAELQVPASVCIPPVVAMSYAALLSLFCKRANKKSVAVAILITILFLFFPGIKYGTYPIWSVIILLLTVVFYWLFIRYFTWCSARLRKLTKTLGLTFAFCAAMAFEFMAHPFRKGWHPSVRASTDMTVAVGTVVLFALLAGTIMLVSDPANCGLPR